MLKYSIYIVFEEFSAEPLYPPNEIGALKQILIFYIYNISKLSFTKDYNDVN
jgi:hypothetical protein